MIGFTFSCATILSAVLVFSSGAVIPQALAQGVTQSIAITGGALPEGNGDFNFFNPPVLNVAGQGGVCWLSAEHQRRIRR
jgi:hypothetical protein